jgi:glycosyltransferase involved in cell wall biosynthesis
MPTLIHVTTVPQTLNFFNGQVDYLTQSGFTVYLVSSPKSEPVNNADNSSRLLAGIPMNRAISPFSDIVALFKLWSLFRNIRPDIVHAHTPKAGLLGTIGARLAGVRVVFVSLFGLPQMTRSGWVQRLLNFTTWLSCSLADRVWCDSFSMREYVVQQKLCQRNKIVVFGRGSVNGIDAVQQFNRAKYSAESQELRRNLCIPFGATVLGYIGRVVKDKGMHELVGAWKNLAGRHADMHLLIVGPFEENDPLSAEDKLFMESDPRIHLVGPQRVVAPFFSMMDIFIMPSYREGFGVTNIEASAMELPVVSTLIPGCIDSVQDGVTGTLVPVRDIEALKSAIEIYIDDVQLRKEHGKNGRERVLRDFQPEVIWKELSKEYSEVLSKKRCDQPS